MATRRYAWWPTSHRDCRVIRSGLRRSGKLFRAEKSPGISAGAFPSNEPVGPDRYCYLIVTVAPEDRLPPTFEVTLIFRLVLPLALLLVASLMLAVLLFPPAMVPRVTQLGFLANFVGIVPHTLTPVALTSPVLRTVTLTVPDLPRFRATAFGFD